MAARLAVHTRAAGLVETAVGDVAVTVAGPDRHRHPGGPGRRAALVEERLALHPVGPPAQRHAAAGHVGHHRRGDPGVVVDHLGLGEPGPGVHDLVQVDQAEGALAHRHLDPLLGGATAVALRRPGSSWPVPSCRRRPCLRRPWPSRHRRRHRRPWPPPRVATRFDAVTGASSSAATALALARVRPWAPPPRPPPPPRSGAPALRRASLAALTLASRAASRSITPVVGGGRHGLHRGDLAVGLRLQQVEDLEPVAVLVAVGLEVARQGVDQLVGQGQLGLGGGHVGQLLQARDVGRGHHLVGVDHGRHHEGPVDRADGHQVLLGPHHEGGDGHPVRLLHGPAQQHVGLAGQLVGHQVVGRVVEHRVDVGPVDEVADVDHPTGLGRQGRQLLVGHDHVGVLGHLVALDDAVVGDLVALAVHPLLADPAVGGRVELVEATFLWLMAENSFTGIDTRPKLMAPLQMARGMVSPREGWRPGSTVAELRRPSAYP